MAGGFYGADVAQLRQLSQQFDTSAERLTMLTRQLSTSINGTSAWKGSDADTFRQHWNGRSKADLLAAGKALQAGSRALRANAQEQEKTSGGASGPPGAPGTPGGPSGGTDRESSTWTTLADTGKAVWDGWGLTRNMVGLGRFAAGADELTDWARGITDVPELRAALQLDNVYGGLSKVDGLLSLGEAGGRFLGGAGMLLDGYSAFQNFKEGDMLAGGYDTFKVALGAASFLPPPAGLVAAGASGLLAVGELVYENWDAISGAASDAWNATSEAAGEAWDAGTDAVEDVVDSGKEFVDDVGDTISDLNPF